MQTVPEGGAVNIKYTIPPPAAGAPAPSQLVIGVDSSGGRLPPAVTVIHHPGESGELEADVDPDGGPGHGPWHNELRRRRREHDQRGPGERWRVVTEP